MAIRNPSSFASANMRWVTIGSALSSLNWHVSYQDSHTTKIAYRRGDECCASVMMEREPFGRGLTKLTTIVFVPDRALFSSNIARHMTEVLTAHIQDAYFLRLLFTNSAMLAASRAVCATAESLAARSPMRRHCSIPMLRTQQWPPRIHTIAPRQGKVPKAV
jgi:hypothetical protein